ncbi:NAD(P)/FAD-dependent oxidoreductase [Candidatus Microgenomates bacterium]|nr:NAD(P)/FAD-dependent oxidoreductase [Candidatus Microgenomates bacterium]
MAAGRAAELGRSVLLVEKNPILGKKLLLTGGGRCNLSNNNPEMRTMLAEYKGVDRFLFSAFSQFGVGRWPTGLLWDNCRWVGCIFCTALIR